MLLFLEVHLIIIMVKKTKKTTYNFEKKIIFFFPASPSNDLTNTHKVWVVENMCVFNIYSYIKGGRSLNDILYIMSSMDFTNYRLKKHLS